MANDLRNNCCAVLTPAGRGAIAVIGVHGTTALLELERLFQSVSGSSLTGNSMQNIFYGVWIATGEDVVVVRATEKRTEIHCHGGRAAAAAILQSLVDAGFRMTEPQEAVALLHPGWWKSAVAMAIPQALTEKTATWLLQQYWLVEAGLDSFRQRLERWTDNNEEAATSEKASLIGELETLLRWYDFGRHLTTPWSVVICGQPNVGKSSLTNAMVGFNRAIVHEIAGTTRDVVSQMTAIDGWPVELKDTAGLRVSESEIERLGIQLATEEIGRADLVILVLDGMQLPESRYDFGLRDANASLMVVNKCDLLDSEMRHRWSAWLEELSIPHNLTSTLTGEGISDLIGNVGNQLVNELPPHDILIPIDSNQYSQLLALQQSLQSGEFHRASEMIEQWTSS